MPVNYGDVSASRQLEITPADVKVASISAPAAQARASGEVTVTYVLESDLTVTASLEVQWSTDGSTYSAATMGTGGDGVTGLATSSAGTTHTYIWNSLTDVGSKVEDEVYLRLRANDGVADSAWTTTSAFTVDNLPLAPALVTPADLWFAKDTTPTCTFTIPTDPGTDNFHFKINFTDRATQALTLSRESATAVAGWEYFDDNANDYTGKRYRAYFAKDLTVAPSVDVTIVHDATTSTSGSAATVTQSHTVGTTQGNRILVVGVSFRSAAAQSVSTITYGGQSLTRLSFTNTGTYHRAELWYLVNPPTGANNVVVTFSASVAYIVGISSYYNVHQTTPFGTAATATGNSTSASVAVTSAVGDLVVDVVEKNKDNEAITAGANQTQRWNRVNSTSGLDNIGAGSSEAGAATVTMSWSWSTARVWAIVAAPLKPASSATVTFASLTDAVRGTALPTTITGARIMLLHKADRLCYVSSVTSTGFTIAKSAAGGADNGLVDVLVFADWGSGWQEHWVTSYTVSSLTNVAVTYSSLTDVNSSSALPGTITNAKILVLYEDDRQVILSSITSTGFNIRKAAAGGAENAKVTFMILKTPADAYWVTDYTATSLTGTTVTYASLTDAIGGAALPTHIPYAFILAAPKNGTMAYCDTIDSFDFKISKASAGEDTNAQVDLMIFAPNITGGFWVPMTSDGVPDAYEGANARYTVQAADALALANYDWVVYAGNQL
jgi:hypothetical protein